MKKTKLGRKIVSIIQCLLLICFSNSMLGCAYTSKYSFESVKSSDKIFYNEQFLEVSEKYEELAKRGDKNNALWNNQLGTIYLAQGNREKALDSLLKAHYLMNNVSAFKELEVRAISWSGSENKKAYKGDPYEKAINSLYVGLLLYEKGDYDNALAAFRNGILADSDSKEEKYKSDFTILYLLASRISKKSGDETLSKDFEKEVQELKEGRRIASLNVKDNAAKEIVNLNNNTILVLELGKGPSKYRTGKHGEKAVISKRDYKTYEPKVIIDGKRDTSIKVYYDADVYFQANTRGGREMDGILKGQAKFKDDASKTSVTMLKASNEMIDSANRTRAANPYADTTGQLAAAGVLALFSLGSAVTSSITNPKADIRYWSLLPAYIYVFPLSLKPGMHKFGISIEKGMSSEIINEFEVNIKEGRDNVIFKRIIKYKISSDVPVTTLKYLKLSPVYK
ncbi:MAG: hypothetical protein P9X22_02970 [Candidatus Zapsychrus exili]|nr:hypothetical protein [Candidatus Zapsychrus exili]